MLSSKIKRTVAVAMATAMMMTSVLPASASEFTSEADETVTSEAQAESNVEETPEVDEETTKEHEEVSEESETSYETSETEDSEASQPEESEVEESETSDESSEEASSETSEKSTEEEITIYDEAQLLEAFQSSAAGKQGGSSIADDTTIIPGTYTITANLYVPGSLNKVLTGIDAYLTNPNNPLGIAEDNGTIKNTAPTTPMTDNATITVAEDGTKTLEIDVKNPVFTLQEIHDGSNVTILDQIRNTNTYGSYTGRVTHLKVKLGDNSGSYSFTNCVEYPTLLNQTWTVPLALSVDLADLPIQIEDQVGDSAWDESVEPYYSLDWLISANYDNFESAEVDGVTLDRNNDLKYYSCFANNGKTYFSIPTCYLEQFTAGTHTLTVNFKDGSKATKTFTTKLNAVQEKIYAPDSAIEYNGKTHYAVSDKGCYTVEGTGYTSKVGKYHVKVTLLDGYTWDDGTTDPVEFDWEVSALKTEKPTIATTSFNYTGEEISLDILDNDGYSVEGVASATKPGSYSATITLNEGYTWSDGSTDSVVVDWTIEGVKVEKPTVSTTSFTYTGEEISLGIAENDGYTIDGVATATKPGSYSATITLNEGYTWSDDSTDSVVVDWTIEGIKVSRPTTSCWTYTGKECYGAKEGEGYTISGDNTATDAGTYTATATLKEGYVWKETGNSEPFTYDWVILAQKVDKPKANTSFVYDFSVKKGYEVTYNGSNLVTKAYTVSDNNRQRYVGTYTTTVTLNKNYIWSDGTTEILTNTWSIVPATVAKSSVYVVDGEFTYDGKIHVPTIHGDDGITASGNLYGINAGTYTAVIGVNEKGYTWDDGTTDKINLTWTIKPAEIEKPEFTNFTFDNEEHTVVPESDYYTITGTSTAKRVGDYTVTVTPKANYCWSDGSTEPYVINWSIKYLTAIAPVANEGLTYTGETLVGVSEGAGYTLEEVTSAVDAGTYEAVATLEDNYTWEDGSTDPIHITWTIDRREIDKPTVYNPTYTGDELIGVDGSDTYTVENGTAKKVGTYNATVKLNPNYAWNDGTTDDLVIEWSINPIVIDKPVAIDGLVYNGETQTGLFEGEHYTLEGETAVNAGTHTATATLEEGYAWSDGSDKPAEIQWTIAKADQKVSTALNYKTYTVWNMKKSAQNFSIWGKANTDVTYKVTRTPKGGSKYVVLDNDGNVILKKGAIKGTYEITVTAAESENYNAATKTVTIKVVRSSQTVTTKVTSKTYQSSTLASTSKSFNIGATAKTTLSYKVTNTPKGGSKYISVDKNGNVTVKKGAVKGRYVIAVTAEETETHKSATSTVTVYVK